MFTASDIINALGGSAELARGTGFPLTTIESWKTVNFIPEWRRPPILELARKKKQRITADDFPPKSARVSSPQPKGRAA
ncbi:carph-isopro domain-containing protein [Caenibius sp. WL]|uniref:carph-isopro domain-containing protein n=1 Tax=Caenibius sp. WL TaxID=2872646 RepID=UPI001C99722A|nr:hypothetical protein [Caenibius sp. WL]QZP07796.1 hypothetical protein K5X80_14255 [Caenibius sp. WL]QZP09971.1 hypothetical protein K5X80_16950 [Caenibius sp. WL]